MTSSPSLSVMFVVVMSVMLLSPFLQCVFFNLLKILFIIYLIEKAMKSIVLVGRLRKKWRRIPNGDEIVFLQSTLFAALRFASIRLRCSASIRALHSRARSWISGKPYFFLYRNQNRGTNPLFSCPRPPWSPAQVSMPCILRTRNPPSPPRPCPRYPMQPSNVPTGTRHVGPHSTDLTGVWYESKSSRTVQALPQYIARPIPVAVPQVFVSQIAHFYCQLNYASKQMYQLLHYSPAPSTWPYPLLRPRLSLLHRYERNEVVCCSKWPVCWMD